MSIKIHSCFLLVILILDVFAKDIRKLCTSQLGNKSCGQCIKQHPECAWCLDPHLTSSFRCDKRTEFHGKCNPSLIYTPMTEVNIKPQHNLPLGSKHADSVTMVQLEPQQVVLRMKPGDIVEVPFKYLHRPQQNIRDFVIQTSEFRSLGVGIEFSMICGGKRVSGRQCANVQAGDQVEFFAKVSLNECKSGGDIAISIGAYGYHTVSAMYITPMCGCDCEKVQNQERRSPMCYGAGDLICGVCECQPDKGGNHCECDLKEHFVSTALQLENKCRKTPDAPLCSGNGQCNCGRCVCNEEHVSGEFCECEGMSCPTVDGRLCSGQGECNCGKCRCEEGFTGDDCSCTLDARTCMESGKVCSDHGNCECGKCVCNEGYTGLTCAITAESELEAPLKSEEDEGYDGDTYTTDKMDNLQDIREHEDHPTASSAEKLSEEHMETPDDSHDDTNDEQAQNDADVAEVLPSAEDDGVTGPPEESDDESKQQPASEPMHGQSDSGIRHIINSFLIVSIATKIFWFGV